MLEGLQTEIDNHPEFIGASKKIIIKKLNENGTSLVETWDVIPLSEEKIKISKLALLTYLTSDQRSLIRSLLENTSEMAQDFKMLYESDNEFWVNDLTFRYMIDSLVDLNIITEEIAITIKRLGERKISRSEELFGRKINIEDFE